MQPIHFATLGGEVEVFNLLVDQFNVDVHAVYTVSLVNSECHNNQ